jgi:hypothetical protein
MNLITIGLLAAASAFFTLGSTADAAHNSILIAGVDAHRSACTLAWAGENESATMLAMGSSMPELTETDCDIEFVTGIAAPEPPAIVLAGMALGGVICGRSLLRKRQKSSKETT